MALGVEQLEKILSRVKNLDAVNVTQLIERLARERKFFSRILDILQEGVLVVNEDAWVDYANVAAQRLLGIHENDIGQIDIRKLMPDVWRLRARSLSEGASANASWVCEHELSYPEARWVRVYVFAMDDSDATPQGRHWVIILSDITQEKQISEELLEEEKFASIMMLAAGVAHEIGNPLNAITIHLQLMDRQLQKLLPGVQREKLKQALDVCSAEVERLDSIIENFLGALKPQLPDFQDVNALAILGEVLAIEHPQMENLGVRVELEFADNMPTVRADANQIKQVFFNIIQNALEAMDRGGTIYIRSSSDDRELHIRFEDTGVGITQENLPKLTQPFFTTKATGHGLGLMLVQRILRGHGGRMSLESSAGRGTQVTITLPLKFRNVRLLE